MTLQLLSQFPQQLRWGIKLEEKSKENKTSAKQRPCYYVLLKNTPPTKPQKNYLSNNPTSCRRQQLSSPMIRHYINLNAMGFAAPKMPELRERGFQMRKDEKKQIGVRICEDTRRFAIAIVYLKKFRGHLSGSVG